LSNQTVWEAISHDHRSDEYSLQYSTLVKGRHRSSQVADIVQVCCMYGTMASQITQILTLTLTLILTLTLPYP